MWPKRDCLHRILLFRISFILAILRVTNIVVALSCISLGAAYNTGIAGCDVTRFHPYFSYMKVVHIYCGKLREVDYANERWLLTARTLAQCYLKRHGVSACGTCLCKQCVANFDLSIFDSTSYQLCCIRAGEVPKGRQGTTL